MTAQTTAVLQAIAGAAAWANGVFFFRFWHDTGDRLFVWFGGAFWLLAVSWVALALFQSHRGGAAVYLRATPRRLSPHHRGDD